MSKKESTEIKVVKETHMPFHTMPTKEMRNAAVLELGEWLDGLLSLTGEKSAARLEVLLPMVEDFAWRSSVPEIKAAFRMYVKGELNIKPKDNYLTVILFNEVMNRYWEIRDSKNVKTEKKDSDELAREHQMILVIEFFDQFVQDNELDENAGWVYLFLEYLGIIKDDKERKQLFYNRAKLESKTKEERVLKAQKELLSDFFRKLIAKDMHIKDLF